MSFAFFLGAMILGLFAQALPFAPIDKIQPNLTHSVVYKGQEVAPTNPLAKSMVLVATSAVGSDDIHQCSGTVIGRQMVITAGHCVSYAYWKPDLMVVSFVGIEGETTRPVKAAYISKEYSGRKDFQSRDPVAFAEWALSDWAILILTEPVPKDFPVVKLGAAPKLKQDVFVAGFGKFDYGFNEDGEIISVGSGKLRTASYVLESTNTATPKSESRQCGGDSGGGVFQVVEKENVLVGVISRQSVGPDGKRACQNSPKITFSPIEPLKAVIDRISEDDFSGLQKFKFF